MKKSIFITGAGSGIGRETALLFSSRGWFVGLADIDTAALTRVAHEIGEDNWRAYALDVTDVEQYREAIASFTSLTNGRLDVLFNNAGILRMGRNEDIPLAQQYLTLDINVKGVLNGIHCALPALRATPGARIVTMCSTSAIYGMPELAVYSASKHAVHALTEALDLELERYGITVSDIMAPYVNTPMITAASTLASSVRSTGINVGPEQVAEVVWKAAHGHRRHWKIHYLTQVLAVAFALLPMLRRPLIKALCLDRQN
ncbi:SDR family oxidoreductase [Burkholderia vietnamiensis]|uniref:SDR family oxidoreductase n=1 Tax=Burkholderia vietnamiensis TaxID=60552 RepID=UPI001B9E1D8A|nr:SDR family oxidoreductase [Burkholderia vietnamiensis]MBR8161937.1 SDR family oxidoreductase [Burkholderia vietnamiensis]